MAVSLERIATVTIQDASRAEVGFVTQGHPREAGSSEPESCAASERVKDGFKATGFCKITSNGASRSWSRMASCA